MNEKVKPPKAVTGKQLGARAIVQGMKDAGINLVAGLPDSWLAPCLEMVREDDDFIYVPVINEAHGITVCAGAWLGGKKPAMVMESSGLLVSAEVLMRLSSYQIPFVMIISHRGTIGEGFSWAYCMGWSLEPVLKALRIPYVVAYNRQETKKLIPWALSSAQGSKVPVAVLIHQEVIK